jgi:hypothetical protein
MNKDFESWLKKRIKSLNELCEYQKELIDDPDCEGSEELITEFVEEIYFAKKFLEDYQSSKKTGGKNHATCQSQ